MTVPAGIIFKWMQGYVVAKPTNAIGRAAGNTSHRVED